MIPRLFAFGAAAGISFGVPGLGRHPPAAGRRHAYPGTVGTMQRTRGHSLVIPSDLGGIKAGRRPASGKNRPSPFCDRFYAPDAV